MLQEENAARSLGVKFSPRIGSLILPQAISGVLIQSLSAAFYQYGSNPTGHRESFDHEERSEGPFAPDYRANLNITATRNATGANALTNLRMVRVISLLGFDLSHQTDFSSVFEYEFDVYLIAYEKPAIKIATGSVLNGRNSNSTSTRKPATIVS